MEWFATSVSLLVIFSLFTQAFSHIFFTYNNVADKACSIYLQHIISKSGKTLMTLINLASVDFLTHIKNLLVIKLIVYFLFFD